MAEPKADQASYFHFTGPMRLDRSIQTLKGLLSGINADGHVTKEELAAVEGWLRDHSDLQLRHPFSEIVPVLDAALDDGYLNGDEVEDLLWLCNQLEPDSAYFDAATQGMQQLQGLLAGVIADGGITDEELAVVSDWIAEREHLRGVWPYGEIESLVTQVRKDKVIDPQERAMLMHFFGEFANQKGRKTISAVIANEVNVPITGLCAVCPEVVVTERIFCFTGASAKVTRKDFQRLVEDRGGKFSANVTQQVHYLVIGNDGNPCWTFSCYGRKVEQAVKLRKAGHQILLVSEVDFWDAFN